MALLLGNEDVSRLLTMDICLEVLEEAYRDLGRGSAVNRPISYVFVPTSDPGRVFSLKSVEGALAGYGVAACRIASDVFSWQLLDGVGRTGGTRALGLVFLFSTQTGELLMICPDAVLQRMRVGGTSGIAAKYLAREDATGVGLLGAGLQAEAQVMALCKVRPISRIKVYSPNEGHRQRFAAEMCEAVGVDIIPAGSPEEAISGQGIVVAATNSLEPVLQGEWLRAGMHVTTVRPCELDATGLARCDVTVVNSRLREPAHYTLGEASESIPEISKGYASFGMIDWDSVRELGELVAGAAPGRSKAEEITFFMNNMGIGIQFAATAWKVYELAQASGVGRKIPEDWFYQVAHP